MKRIVTITFLTLLTFGVHAQLILPERDSANRDTLSFYDYDIVENDGFCSVLGIDRTTDKYKRLKTSLTGRFMYQDSNSRTVDMELKDGNAVGDWQYYSHTFQGPIISSTISFINGYKNGTENIYSYEWNNETERFESYLRQVVKHNMGKKLHDISYWPNAQTSMEYQFDKEGRMHGQYISLNSDGSVSARGKYEYGKRIDEWEYFNSKGEIDKRVFYKDGLVHTTTYHPGGKPRISKTTRNRVLEGKYLNLDEKGDTIAYHFYNDGIEQGRQISHVFTGYWTTPATVHYYTNDKGVIQGMYKQYFYGTDILRVRGQYNDEGIRYGVWEYYVEDGRLYRAETIENNWVKASHTRRLQNKNGQFINAQYHLESYPMGAIPRKVEERPFFLFSE